MPSPQIRAEFLKQDYNSLAVPVPLYSFGIIDWKRQKVKKLAQKTRKLLNKQTESDCTSNGGCRLIELKSLTNNQES